ncbi:hypothetical protein, partial [Klebsiella pneumoniae]|uniref:hypothetical protein n=1 Tax=Klebsiella pneumoniae TaxID=573 RepID=UPI00405552EC
GLKKIGKANLIETNGGDMIITVAVSWSNLILHYDVFKYDFLILDINDSLTVKVNDNTVLLNATFSYGMHDRCSMKLNLC